MNDRKDPIWKVGESLEKIEEFNRGEPMNDRIQEIRDRHVAATPGPWYWHGYLKSQDVDLVSETSGHPTVMGFRRWGMSGAAPAFNKDGAMERIDYGMIETRKSHVSEFYKIDHPDADLIKNSWSDVSYLLLEVERLQTENERLNNEMDSMMIVLEDRSPYAAQKYWEYLLNEREQMKETLEWYANEVNYTIGRYTGVDEDGLLEDWVSRVQEDTGEKARTALSHLKG